MHSLETYLQESGLSVEQFASLSGVKSRTIYRILARDGHTGVDKILKLSRASGIPVETLLLESLPAQEDDITGEQSASIPAEGAA